MHTISAKVTEWLDSDEYWTDIDKMRTAIMRDASHAENEATTASIFERELYHLIKTKTTMELSYVRESPVSQLTHRFDARRKRTSGRGRLDAVINNLVIEYKHYSKLQTKEQFLAAAGQVTDYLTGLYAAEGVKYNAILTDGLKISYFDFSGERVEHSMLSSLSNEDLDTAIRAILFNRKKQFVPDNIVRDFSISSQADSISKSVALTLYDSLKNGKGDIWFGSTVV